MKKYFTALCALAIALLLTVPAAAEDGVNSSGTTSLSDVLNGIDFDSDNSIQLMFAKLQLAQAQLCKDSANSCMQQIQELQKEQDLTADTLEKMRRLQSEGATEMPEDMLSFMRDRGLDYCEPKDFDCWAYNIESLTVYQDSLASQTQSLMVNLQDFMGQYNSYLQGANSSVNSAADTLAAIAASKSGSLFSTDGGTTAVGGQYALVAFAALIGGAGGTALMWAILNRKKPSKAMTEGTEA